MCRCDVDIMKCDLLRCFLNMEITSQHHHIILNGYIKFPLFKAVFSKQIEGMSLFEFYTSKGHIVNVYLYGVKELCS